MTITVLVHLEPGLDEPVAWWGESPDLPGFSVAANSLRDLIARAGAAVAEILQEEGRPLEGVKYRLVDRAEHDVNPNPISGPARDRDDRELSVTRVSQPLAAA